LATKVPVNWDCRINHAGTPPAGGVPAFHALFNRA
jgi:hypothetical protein